MIFPVLNFNCFKEEIEDADHIMAPPSKENHSKISPSMELVDADRVQDLEKALELYYRKYKEQKESKNQLREVWMFLVGFWMYLTHE